MRVTLRCPTDTENTSYSTLSLLLFYYLFSKLYTGYPVTGPMRPPVHREKFIFATTQISVVATHFFI